VQAKRLRSLPALRLQQQFLVMRRCSRTEVTMHIALLSIVLDDAAETLAVALIA